MPQTKEQRAAILAQLLADPDDPRHGSVTGYRYSCRCTRCSEARRNDYAEHADEKRDRVLRSKYGPDFGAAAWDSLYAEQGGRCPICERPMTKAHERPKGQRHLRASDAVVDHEHRTGWRNQLLCCRCNVTLGQFNNDPAIFIRFAQAADTYHSADYFEDRAATTPAGDSTA